jgi:hypothetical protein
MAPRVRVIEGGSLLYTLYGWAGLIAGLTSAVVLTFWLLFSERRRHPQLRVENGFTRARLGSQNM